MEWGLYKQDTIFGGGDGGSCSSEIVLTVSLIGRNFAFQNGLGFTIKTPQTLRKQPKTANTNSPWEEGLVIGWVFASEICGAYFREGLFLEGLIIGILR